MFSQCSFKFAILANSERTCSLSVLSSSPHVDSSALVRQLVASLPHIDSSAPRVATSKPSLLRRLAHACCKRGDTKYQSASSSSTRCQKRCKFGKASTRIKHVSKLKEKNMWPSSTPSSTRSVRNPMAPPSTSSFTFANFVQCIWPRCIWSTIFAIPNQSILLC